MHFSHASPTCSARPTARWWRRVREDVDSGETRRIGASSSSSAPAAAAICAAAEVAASPKAHGYGGFPVSGIWLRCDEPAISRPSSRQGLRQGRGRLAADVGAASRHAHHRRQAVAAVRALCRLLDQVPQARLVARSLPSRSGPTTSCRCWPWRATTSRSTEYLIGQVLQTSAPSLRGAARVLSEGRARATGSCEVAGQRVQIIKTDQQHSGIARVRHRDRGRRRPLARRPARRVARRLDRRVDHGAHAGELLRTSSSSATGCPRSRR